MRSAAVMLIVASALPGLIGATAPPAKNRIVTCRDAKGQPVITDPSDSRCYTPPPSEDTKAAIEERRRKDKEAYLACKAEQRSDQSLLSRYPTKDKHDAARQQALSQVEATLRISQARLDQLAGERQHLRNEVEFYPNGKLPPKLRHDLDSNTALIEAQTEAIVTQKDDAAQKNKFYDDELIKLKKLWLPQADRHGCAAPPD